MTLVVFILTLGLGWGAGFIPGGRWWWLLKLAVLVVAVCLGYAFAGIAEAGGWTDRLIFAGILAGSAFGVGLTGRKKPEAITAAKDLAKKHLFTKKNAKRLLKAMRRLLPI